MCESGHHVITWSSTNTQDSAPPAGAACACGAVVLTNVERDEDDANLAILERMWARS